MFKIASKTIETMERRCLNGRNTEDQSAKPLSPEYKARKAKSGKPGIRNLMDTGDLFRAIRVTEVDDRHAVISIIDSKQTAIAAANQKIDTWFGISPADAGKVCWFAATLLDNRNSK
jgi:phosphate starvation-inducible protein PhoH